MGRPEDRRRLRPWLWALVASAAVHAALFLWLGRTVPMPPVRLAPATPIEVTIEETRRPAPAVLPRTPIAPPAAPVRRAIPHRTGLVAAKPTGPAPQGSLDAPPPLRSPTEAASSRPLDLALRQPLEPVLPGGETIRNAPGEMPPRDTRSLAQSRIDAWIEDDSARRRVEHGLVDDWFSGLRRSLDSALAKHPPPTEALGSVARTVAQDYLRQAEAYGKGNNPAGDVAPGPKLSDSSVERGAANEALGHPGTFSSPIHGVSEAGLWAVVELDYDLDGQLKRSRLVQSSGNGAFNQHVLKIIALGLADLASPPDAGLGVHPEGTRSLWEVDGHLTFDRDVRQLGLKDAWYLPIAAATALMGGGFDETTGYVGYTDFRHPHLTCDVKLLGVY